MHYRLLNLVVLSALFPFAGCDAEFGAPTPKPPNSVDEVENNNLSPGQSALRSGQTLHGVVNEYRDTDYFTVERAGAGQTLRLTLEVKEELPAGLDFWQLAVAVQDHDRTPLGNFDLQPLAPANLIERRIVLPAGRTGAQFAVLEVRAGGYMPVGSKYRLTVAFE